MSTLPPAIIFINNDFNSTTIDTLASQLHLDGYISFDEFNSRVVADPNYPAVVHLQGQRIMVMLPTFQDTTNRALADVVLFYNQGQVTVLKNNFGPPGLSLPIARLNIYVLLRDVGSKYVVILPPSSTAPPRSLGGIVVDQGADSSGVHDPNPDSEKNNLDFINRK